MPAHPLIPYLFDRQPHLLRPALAEWLAASPRFAAFAERYKDKIRKKIRVLNGEEKALDLLAELEMAWLLLGAEKGLELAYEPYAGEKRRGPDFGAVWRSSLAFTVEVTRLRSGAEAEARLADMVCDKLGQLQPGMINLLAVFSSDSPPDVAGAMQRLKLAAETRHPALFARHGYRAPADFFKGYERLSAILLRPGAGLPAALWPNPQARQPLPAKLSALLGRLG